MIICAKQTQWFVVSAAGISRFSIEMGKLTEPSTKLGMVDIPAVSKFVSDVANNRLSPCTTNDDERCESSNAHNVISIRTRLKTLASTDWTKAGMVEVKVGEIVALDHFYLLPDDAGQRQCLEAELGRFYEHLEGVGMVDESIGYYATKMKASNVWARVKIITWPEPKQEGHYFCQFLDYGLIDMIDGRALLPLDDRFKMAPPMAIKCALFGLFTFFLPFSFVNPIALFHRHQTFIWVVEQTDDQLVQADHVEIGHQFEDVCHRTPVIGRLLGVCDRS